MENENERDHKKICKSNISMEVPVSSDNNSI